MGGDDYIWEEAVVVSEQPSPQALEIRYAVIAWPGH